MSFSERAKLTALAIVKIFETSRPFGDYSAVAVLDDGAGVSYGTSQFTHRSGSLRAVLLRFHKICEETGVQPLLVGYEDLLSDQSPRNILKLSQDERFKNGLRAAGEREAMRQAQREIAYEMYLKPALDACEGSDFECPLSLAVIYDSINHGSYQAIRDRVTFQGPGNGSIKPEEFEREWIFRYVKARHAWLNSKPRLVKTAYRTKFFLEQIARDNWNLDFPMIVHGYRLTEKDIPTNHFEDLSDDEIDIQVPVVEPVADMPDTADVQHTADVTASEPVGTATQESAGFTPEKFQAFIPQIDTAKAWIKRATTGTFLAGVGAFVLGLPMWLQIALVALLFVIAIGAVVLFVKYHDKVFEYVGNMNTLRATEGVHDPMVSAETPKN